jgi:hypothetical protein
VGSVIVVTVLATRPTSVLSERRMIHCVAVFGVGNAQSMRTECGATHVATGVTGGLTSAPHITRQTPFSRAHT